MKKIYHILKIIRSQILFHYCNLFRSSCNRIFSEISREIDSKKNGLILYEGLWDHPYHWLRLSIFRKALSPKYGSGLVGVYHELSSKNLINSLLSFHPNQIEIIPSSIDQKYFDLAEQKLSKVKTPSDIMKIDIAPGYPTHYFYDGVLKMELIGQIDVNQTPLIKHLALTLFYIDFYQKLFTKYDFKATVVSHPTTIRFSTLVWASICSKVPTFVLNQRNSHIQIRKLKDLEEIGCVPDDVPFLDDLNSLSFQQRNNMINAGKLFLGKMREGSEGEISVTNTYNKENQSRKVNSEMLANLVGGDPQKKNVVVLSSCWPDFPNYQGESFFADHVEWLDITLNEARNNNKYNWIFKPHPAEYMYGKIGLLQLLSTRNTVGTYIWPNELPSNALIDCVDCVVTALGSVGFEYPAMGARSLVSRNTSYTNWGFSNFASTKDEYILKLKSACELPLPTIKNSEDAYIYLMYRMAAPEVCQSDGYKYPWPSLSFHLWPKLPRFYKNNKLNIEKEIKLMSVWLDSDSKSYNVFKWQNSNLW